MKKCGKPVRAASGVDRRFCTKRSRHLGGCGNRTCYRCGTALTRENAPASVFKRGQGECTRCAKERAREKHGRKPRNIQHFGGFHQFSCGCSGILPNDGQANKFVRLHGRVYSCRVAAILNASRRDAIKGGYTSIPNTPHFVIRKLMDEKLCWRCKQPLEWAVGNGKTPHLHHNHETGEICGFTHPHCNPKALEYEIDELKQRIRELEVRQAIPLAA